MAALLDHRLLVARRASPLLVRGRAGEVVLASDAAALGSATGPLRVLRDGDVADLTAWAWRRGDGTAVALNLSDGELLLEGLEGAVLIGTDRSRDGEAVAGALRLGPGEGAVVDRS